MCNGKFPSKLLTENVVISRYNFSLSGIFILTCTSNFPRGRYHFSLLSGPSFNPVEGSKEVFGFADLDQSIACVTPFEYILSVLGQIGILIETVLLGNHN